VTIIALPSPEPKATITGFTPSGEPIWSIIPMHRLRDRKAGWMEVPADMPRETTARPAA
jgi:hypothetical protein